MIDLFNTAVTSVSTARQIVDSMIEIRDFNNMATTVTELNKKLFEVQSALTNISIQWHSTVEEIHSTKDKLRLISEKLEERKNYTLFQLSVGVFVYIKKGSHDGTVKENEPIHYVCQPCLDNKGIKAVLFRKIYTAFFIHVCPVCKTEYPEKQPSSSPVVGTRSRNPYTV